MAGVIRESRKGTFSLLTPHPGRENPGDNKIPGHGGPLVVGPPHIETAVDAAFPDVRYDEGG